MTKISHPFHLVTPSPWPVSLSVTLLATAISLVLSIINNNIEILLTITLTFIVAINSFIWWRDVNRESSLQGSHSSTTVNILNFSIIIFICSEVIFFLSFFWAFFHSSISPDINLGNIWPPNGISIFNPIGIPILNSIILVSSGATITWSHHSFLNNNTNSAINSLLVTISLGAIFSLFQGIEYFNAQFSFSDSIYGSIFFLTTGFHGIHVIIGTLFLISSIISINSIFNSPNHFISFDLSAWYWHFVDVVWLFLFSSIYWWGSI